MPNATSAPIIDIILTDNHSPDSVTKPLIKAGYKTRQFRIDDLKISEPSAHAVVVLCDEQVSHTPRVRALYPESIPIVSILSNDNLCNKVSAIRSGATRYISLPVTELKVITALESLGITPIKKPYQVLLIDDDTVSMAMTAGILRNVGMEVICENVAEAALNIIRHSTPDLLLVDLHMPEMTGLELVLILREHEGFQDLPIIFITADEDIDARLAEKHMIGEDYLLKPIDGNQLIATVTSKVQQNRHKALIRDTLSHRMLEHHALNEHAIVSITDIKGTITYANDMFCQISGYSRQELIGENHRILKSGEHPDEFYKEMWKTIAAGKVWHGTICNRNKSGELYWVESSITPLLNDKGRPTQYIAIRTDISPIVRQKIAMTKLMELIHSNSYEEFTNSVASALTEAFNVDVGFVATKDPEVESSIQVISYKDKKDSAKPLQPKIFHKLFQLSDLQITHGLSKELYQEEEVTEESFDACIAVPLKNQDGSQCGIMGVMSRKCLRDRFEIQTVLAVIADRISSEIRRFNLEDKLADNEQKFRTLVNNIPGMVYRAGADWKAEYVTNVKMLCGITADELNESEQGWLGLIHPVDRQRVLDESDILTREEMHLVQEYRIRNNDNEWLWVADHKQSHIAKSGAFLGVDGIVFDVTERKQADMMIEQQRERLRRGQEYADLGTWDWNIETGELYWTEQISALFGYNKGELDTTYENFLNAVHPDDRDLVSNAVTACIETNKPYDIEHRVVWPNGTVRWLSERGAVTRDKQGNAVQMLGVVQDIHDKKVAQLELAEREKQLEEAQHLARLGNWSIDLSTNTMFWSQEVFNILGVAAGQFEPQLDSLLHFVHPNDRELVQQATIDIENEQARDIEFRVVKPNGDICHIHELAQVIHDEKGGKKYIKGTIQDITTQKIAELAVIKARDDAEKANKAKSDFLSSMSHELRTPLNAILGFSQLLEHDADASEDQLENVLEIRKAGSHLLELINEILDLSKIESGKIDLSITSVDTCEIVDDVIGLSQQLAEKGQIALSHNCNKSSYVLADKLRLKQVLINLVSNAIKYNKPGGSVSISSYNQNEMAIIKVSDTGLGIPEDKLEDIFKPFNRLGAELTNVEGTGIGLAITKRIVNAMGGKILVSSELGKGSCFTIQLPTGQLVQQDLIVTESSEILSSEDEPESNLITSILYIEDNEANARLVNKLVNRLSYVALIHADTGKRGLQVAKTQLPDLILLDINLPDMSGFEVMALLKAEPQLAKIPVVAISANAMKHDIDKAKGAGFQEYITKPIRIEHFYAVIDTFLKPKEKGDA